MKNLIVFGLTLVSLQSFATVNGGPFTGKKYQFCKGQTITQKGNSLLCKNAKNFSLVLGAESKSIENIPFQTVGVTDADDLSFELLPDSDTNHIYRFEKALVDNDGIAVGYMSIDGYESSEADVKMQVTARYNLSGELVSASVK